MTMVFGGFGLLICIAAIHLPSGENDPFESCPSTFVIDPFDKSSNASLRSAKIRASDPSGDTLSTRHGDPARQSEASITAQLPTAPPPFALGVLEMGPAPSAGAVEWALHTLDHRTADPHFKGLAEHIVKLAASEEPHDPALKEELATGEVPRLFGRE